VTTPARAPLSSRACQSAAQVFAFDRTLAQAFVQLDADHHAERAAHARLATPRAWLALLRLLVTGAPATLVRRVVDLPWAEARTIALICVRLFAFPLVWIASALLRRAFGSPPAGDAGGDTIMAWMVLFFIWMLSGTAVSRLRGKHSAAAVVIMLTAAVGVSLLTSFVVVPLYDDARFQNLKQMCLLGFLYPSIAAQAAWLSAQLSLRGRGFLEGISGGMLVGGGMVISIAGVAVVLVATQLSDTQLAFAYLALIPLSLAGTAFLTARIARHPIVEPGTRTTV
jgi:hypothetical protein